MECSDVRVNDTRLYLGGPASRPAPARVGICDLAGTDAGKFGYETAHEANTDSSAINTLYEKVDEEVYSSIPKIQLLGKESTYVSSSLSSGT
jgi:hypothetical protein